ncbi:hypothetical protein BJ912DRAFT_1044565 [Pholiota molesta]|nr:hypothetical protein BJ912DRAFT_1044565 [Pholiota molesta]
MLTTWLPCCLLSPYHFKRNKTSSDMTTPEPEYEQPRHSDSDSESAIEDHLADAPPKPFDLDTVARIVTRLSRRWHQGEQVKAAIADFSEACEADRAIWAKEAICVGESGLDNPEAEEDESEEPESDEETRQVRKMINDLDVPELGPPPGPVQDKDTLTQSREHAKQKARYMLAFINASIEEHEKLAEEHRRGLEEHLNKVAVIKERREKFLACIIRDRLN